MKVITVKLMPPRSTKASYLKVSADGVPDLRVSRTHGPESLNQEVVLAAVAMCKRQEWSTNIVGGQLPKSDTFVFCFIDSHLCNLETQQ